MTIIAGDIIKPRVGFTKEEVLEAAKKRYRTEVCIDQMDDAMKRPTLKEAVDVIIADSIYWDGHDRNVILTQEELKARQQRSDAEGVITALVKVLEKGGADELTLKKAVRDQVAMRRMKVNADHLSSSIVRVLTDRKHVTIRPPSQRGGDVMTWSLKKNHGLDKAMYMEIYELASKFVR
jgi:hypothetical protein